MSDSRQAAFADHFSSASCDYARYRPGYPDALFDWLVERAPARRRAWDCATGSGQAALPLAARFAHVVASDASREQVAAAAPHAGVSYLCARAESSALADGSVDVVTVAQALHWFATDAFFDEARRVLVPGGLLAAWSYGLLRVDAEVDAVVDTLYRDVLGAYWPPERAHVDRGYRDLPFPLDEVAAPALHLEVTWTLADLAGYLGTWSATQRYRRATGADPVDTVRAELTSRWGDPSRARVVRWPLVVRAGVAR